MKKYTKEEIKELEVLLNIYKKNKKKFIDFIDEDTKKQLQEYIKYKESQKQK
jgi:hypothetical protein